MTYVQYCSKCERKTEHVWIQIDAPVEYQTHGRITDTVGWLGCRECRKVAELVKDYTRLRAINAELRKILARALAEEKCGADGVFFMLSQYMRQLFPHAERVKKQIDRARAWGYKGVKMV